MDNHYFGVSRSCTGGFGGAAFLESPSSWELEPVLAGLALTEPIGLILAGSISAETTAAEIILALIYGQPSLWKRQVDIMQTVSSVITAAVTFVVAA